MGFLSPKPKTPAQTPPVKLANMHITEAVVGKAVAFLNGQRRLTQSLIGYTDFNAIEHKKQTSSGGGGKGLGGGGGSSQATTTYTYQAATRGALCSGPVSGLVNVWDSKGRFQQTSVTESFTIPVGGGSYTVNNHGLFKLDQGVGFAQAYSRTVNDYGSSGSVTLSGSYQAPLTPGPSPAPGVYSQSGGTYHFHAADAGKVLNITYSFNLLQISSSEVATVPSSPFQILIDGSSDFLQDAGVSYYPSGTALQKVAGSPAGGQYSVSGLGLYQFAAADLSQQVQINFVKNSSNQNSDAQTALNLTLIPGTRGQAPWSYLTSRHPEQAVGNSELAMLVSDAMTLGSNAEMPNLSFEIAGPYQFGAGIVDCDPADSVTALLADPFAGIDFPASALGDWTQASDFWVANSFFISPMYDSQSPVASRIGEILEAGMTAGFWSEGLYKLAPYGDTSAAGNGQIYVPDTQPIVDFTDTDYIGDGLVKITRSAWQDANNKVQIQWSNRLNAYNSEITTEQDDAAIQRYGLRTEDPRNWDFICTLAAAQFAANLRVKRSVNIRAQYQFSVKSNYPFLEPMNLVTLTVTELGMNKVPVRITKIVDHPDENGLEITAEEFPWGTAKPTLYAKQTGSGFKPDAGQADPGNTTALVFEAPDRLALQQGNMLYIFCCGSTPDWGGCQIFMSFDGVNYMPYGDPITSSARLGTLVNSLGIGSVDPDPSSFQVKMTTAGSILPAMSTADFNQLVPLCALIDATDNNPFEMFAYKNATLVGKDTFQLDTLHRGLMGTTNSAHTAGETFVRLDQASAQWQYDPSYYGKTINFKFPSFNKLGRRAQPLSQASAYSFVLPGNGPGAVDLITGIYRPGLGSIPPSWTGTITWASPVPGTSVTISWNITVNRGSMPTPSQPATTLVSQNYTGSQVVTGLTASTNYWFYPYLDDTQPGSPLLFVMNSQVAGAVGSPAIAYTALTPNATYFSGRNDHLPVNDGPLKITTAPTSGSGSGGSGDGMGGACPRGDMVVLHREKGIILVQDVVPGDWIRDRGGWVEVLDVHHQWTSEWTEVETSCGEDLVVTPGHTWPTDAGDKRTNEMEIGSLLQLGEEGNTGITGKRPIRGGGLCVGLIVSGDRCYLLGRNVPKVRSHNGGGVLPRS